MQPVLFLVPTSPLLYFNISFSLFRLYPLRFSFSRFLSHHKIINWFSFAKSVKHIYLKTMMTFLNYNQKANHYLRRKLVRMTIVTFQFVFDPVLKGCVKKYITSEIARFLKLYKNSRLQVCLQSWFQHQIPITYLGNNLYTYIMVSSIFKK